MRGKVKFDKDFKNISYGAKNLILKMMKFDFRKRISALDAVNDP